MPVQLPCLLTLSTPHEAQDRTVELSLSHFMPSSHPLHKALEDWAASIEKTSRGTIDYKIYPAQQLGKAFFPAGTAAFFGIDQILKYHMDAPLCTTAFVIVINKAPMMDCRLARKG